MSRGRIEEENWGGGRVGAADCPSSLRIKRMIGRREGRGKQGRNNEGREGLRMRE